MIEKRLPAKKLSIRRREHSFKALNRIHCSYFLKGMLISFLCHNFFLIQSDDYPICEEFSSSYRLLFAIFYQNYLSLRCIDSTLLWRKLPKIHRVNIQINDLQDNFIYTHFRFHNKEQLRRLLECFQFPDFLRSSNGLKFSKDEVLLCGLYRLHFPNRYYDIGWMTIFGFDYQTASRCFQCFFTWMIHNWSYLLVDHWDYWVEFFHSCTLAIHNKLSYLGCPFPLPHEPYGFRIFGFIDNVILKTCRPGGADGEGAPRKDPLIQRTWYSGWKKCHGLKFQTIDLPNGMNANVYGPLSCRRNDLLLLGRSGLNEQLAGLQRGQYIQFKIYGDSAYIPLGLSHVRARHENAVMTPREILENDKMSSCRQSIEWNYNDLKQYWKMIDYQRNLELFDMPVIPMALCAMILRNAHVTMNGNTTSSYFDCTPPSLESWTSQGPRQLREE
jgi:nuclease HARBI1